VAPRLLSDRALLGSLDAHDIDQLWEDLANQPFFVSSTDRARTAERFLTIYASASDEIVRTANAALRHEFDLLGSGTRALGTPLPWHTDFKTDRRWPLAYSSDIDYIELECPSDVKVPWELSRCQHFTRLGQAYWLTGDDRYADEFVAQTSDWLTANPYAYGVNWACAMDVALRAVSWIWGFYFFADSLPCRKAAFRSEFLRGLFLHGEFLATHLEKGEVNGNHYLCDGVGLVFLGSFFRRARRAARWRALGRSIVIEEIFNQTTPDGVDFEASTAYHRLVLEAFLTSYELLRRQGEEVPVDCRSRLERMCEFVQAYTKPSGQTPLIGDADDGRIQILGSQGINDHRYLLSTAAILFGRGDFKRSATRCWEETFWLVGVEAPERFCQIAADTGLAGSTAFPDGGFYVLRACDTHLIIDCGPVGMAGRGGHGHNDILSFELFLNGFNVITDCGAYLYTASRDWRNRFRSTAFHNTVQVDGEELNRFVDPDALWQLHDDAKPVAPVFRRDNRVTRFRGAHSGYRRLVPPVVHTRECLVLIADGWQEGCQARVLVRDWVEGDGEHEIVWRFHLDPAVTPTVEGCDVRLSCGGRSVWLMPDKTAAGFLLSLEPGWVSPSYGVKLPTTVLVWRVTSRLPVTASYLFAVRRLSRSERTEADSAQSHAPDSAE
jgi:hypothetical protein